MTNAAQSISAHTSALMASDTSCLMEADSSALMEADSSALMAAKQLIQLRGARPDGTNINSPTPCQLKDRQNDTHYSSISGLDSKRFYHFVNAFESTGSQAKHFSAKLRDLRDTLRDASLCNYKAVFLKTTIELTSHLLHWIAQTHKCALLDQDLQRKHEMYSYRLADLKQELELDCDDSSMPPKAKRARKSFLPLTQTLLHPGNSAQMKAKKLTPIIFDVAQHLLQANAITPKKLERVQKAVFIAATSTLFGISPTKAQHQLGK